MIDTFGTTDGKHKPKKKSVGKTWLIVDIYQIL